ncbi:flavodoxin [Thermococcus sp. P6]|uniref:flavodoxin family protein n=1 Tax=Thermococcus sp. P6 TaxID=122420 RepID=UPI000B59A635|nr:flavodoxin family protein [Thermococcus sp. P6]ASJ11291.1 flavodoxin [Thermococcus sp. P6]
MKILVVFYSRTGNTRKAAKIMAEVLNADVDEVIDKKNRRGILGFLRAGYDATRGKTTEIEFQRDPSDYDLVVIGSPTWNSRVTPAIRTYLMKNGEKIKKAAFFTTCAGRSRKCLSQMEEILGKKPLKAGILLQKSLERDAREFAEELKKGTA